MSDRQEKIDQLTQAILALKHAQEQLNKKRSDLEWSSVEETEPILISGKPMPMMIDLTLEWKQSFHILLEVFANGNTAKGKQFAKDELLKAAGVLDTLTRVFGLKDINLKEIVDEREAK